MIKEFIQKYLSEKLARHHSLVIYDPKLFYHDLVMEMASENLKVFDASQNVVIAREEAMEYWVQDMPKSIKNKLIFYVPFPKKVQNDQKAIDPFIVFASGGLVFPDEATDDYKQLCLSLLPDQAAKIEELFAHDSYPAFGMIDALQGGSTFPVIKNGLGASSPTEILEAFLAPDEKQKAFLEQDNAWVNEFKEFMANTIGVKPTTRKFESLQGDLWRIVLFSEFIYDLPVDIPKQLKDVPKAKSDAQSIIYKVCKQLRERKNKEEIYVFHANAVSEELSLPALFKNETNLGEINTFAFEDSSFYNKFKAALIEGQVGMALKLATTSSQGIWGTYDDERRAAWQIGKKSCELVAAVNANKEQLKKLRTTEAVVSWYAKSGYQLDTLHRELEKEVQAEITFSEQVEEVVEHARSVYQSFMDGIQKIFQAGIEEEGAINVGIQRNTTFFDKNVAPLINAGKKTVYFLADAMRYELADYLFKKLDKADFDCSIQPTLAFSPTVTKYGMAALMPEAEKNLELKVVNGKLEPFLNGIKSDKRSDRIAYTKEIYGDKLAWYWEQDIISGQYEKCDILFVTTTEIDQAGENTPDNAQENIEKSITKILKIATLLKNDGYEEFVLAADHGFVLLDSYKAGNNADKPIGEWALEKSRCLAGKGDTNAMHIMLSADQLGVKSEVNQFLFLKNYATYERGKKFFHEGLSLQECITPCLLFRPRKKIAKQDYDVNLTYKGKDSGHITTRRPSLEISCFGDSLFGDAIDVMIETYAGDTVVGILLGSEHVNTTSGYVEIMPGQSVKVTIAMEDDFDGAFTVIAKAPSTGMIYSEIKLETDYL